MNLLMYEVKRGGAEVARSTEDDYGSANRNVPVPRGNRTE